MRDDNESRLAWLAEGNLKQARKRVSAKALIQDGTGRVLLVNPNYKEYWDLPGGMAEANEPPRAALEREIIEELALGVSVGRLLTLDWVGPHGPWDDQLVFIFECGTLTSEEISNLKISDSEITDFGFFPMPDAMRLLRDDVAARLEHAVSALKAEHTRYAENHPTSQDD